MPDFDYFCSANVAVYIGSQPLLDAAGISYDIQESRRPIYGYSSRFFDAVSRGNVLVTGDLLVNYINQDYLFDAINSSLGIDTSVSAGLPTVTDEVTPDVDILDSISRSGSAETIKQYENAFWNVGPGGESNAPGQATQIRNTFNPIDMSGGVSIKVVFGEQGGTVQNGQSSFLLEGVHFTSRGQRIVVDQEVIVEQYSFIARNVRTLQNPYTTATTG